MRYTRRLACALLLGAFLAVGCGGGDGPLVDREFLIVIEDSLYEPLEASLEQYAETMLLAQFNVRVVRWIPGTVQELKALLYEQVDSHGIEGALLIGELPAAWYEQVAFNKHEEFPIDLYLQDRDAEWGDEDEDGIFDSHTDLDLDLYTSRLTGTPAQLVDYFARAYHYRREGPLVDVSAFVFVDDSWSRVNTRRPFYLDDLYSNVDIIKDVSDSTLDNYLDKLTGDGAEFVFQWVHASSGFMRFDDLDGDRDLTYRSLRDDYPLKASFVNMFNCSAARFTGPNLAEHYTVGTGYGLAIIGSTKTGAVNDTRVFHENLVLGRRWGEAFQIWFNKVGKQDDEWHLGIVIMGDPLLRLTGDLYPSGATEASFTDPGIFVETMEQIAAEADLSTFEEYREMHPEFFED